MRGGGFDGFFGAAMGSERRPYDYQRRLAGGDEGTECISQLIDIPTGLGKTAAVVLAWLWNRSLPNSSWPRRLVYCLPMRTLVEQTRDNTKIWVEKLKKEKLLTNVPEIHVLMGGEEARDWDIYPERDAILIGTQDMLLSRALNRGYGMSRYRWPMHFGLLNNDCLWVMDETQLMGPGLWTSGQMDWMRNQRFGVMKPCLTWWMSATNSPVFLDTPDRRKQKLTRLPITEVGDDPRAISRLNPTRPLGIWTSTETKPKSKKKNVAAMAFGESLASAINAEHQPGTLSLVVCNSVGAAQEVFRRLSVLHDVADVVLLTSRFRRGDRNANTGRLLAFEEQRKKAAEDSKEDTLSNSAGLICISTQVIEAGIDISARRLWMESAPWPSILQRLGRLNRDGRADGKSKALVFVWPDDGKKGKGSFGGPYEPWDIAAAAKLVAKLARIYENEPTLGASIAISKLRATDGPQMDAALKPKDEPFPRAIDVHGLFSTEPDVFGGFTDVSKWVRGEDKNADVTVFWREFEGTKGPGKSTTLTGPPFAAEEGCAVAVHRLREFLSENARAFVWDDRLEEWQARWPNEICPGMVVMLPRTAGGYTEDLGWTGEPAGKISGAPPPGRFSVSFDDDPDSKQPEWVTLESHLKDAEGAAIQIVDALNLNQGSRTAVVAAAGLHDIGKAHPVWQAALPTSTQTEKQLWAKAPFFKCYPRPEQGKPCIRHEAASALAAWTLYFRKRVTWPGLTIFLIACHHGKVRTVLYARGNDGDVCGVPKEPVLLPWAGGMEMDFSCAAMGSNGTFSDDGQTFTLGSPGWTALIADLLGGWEQGPEVKPAPLTLQNPSEPRCLGPFRMAYLEALLRAADARL